jgi:DNA-binding response OmpR family regulator
MGDRTRRILIVEDEALIALHIEALVHELGFVVLGPAAHIDTALKIIERERVDGAVLDIHLDGNSTSYPVAEALEIRGIPFVFVTGIDKGGMASLFPRAPVIRKPFPPAELQAALSRVLGNVG